LPAEDKVDKAAAVAVAALREDQEFTG